LAKNEDRFMRLLVPMQGKPRAFAPGQDDRFHTASGFLLARDHRGKLAPKQILFAIARPEKIRELCAEQFSADHRLSLTYGDDFSQPQVGRRTSGGKLYFVFFNHKLVLLLAPVTQGLGLYGKINGPGLTSGYCNALESHQLLGGSIHLGV
jgi:hypothetical protein